MNLVDRNNWLGWNELPKAIEGHTGKYIRYQTVLYNFLKILKPKNILEIGFNAGHSACCFLNACPTTKMYTFDICRHGTEEPARDVLKKYFDLTLIKGDSTKTIPEFFKSNHIYFDFIFIDGYHHDEVPYYDIMNTKFNLAEGGFMLIDDLGGQIDAYVIKSNILNELPGYVLNNIEKQAVLLYKNKNLNDDLLPDAIKKFNDLCNQ